MSEFSIIDRYCHGIGISHSETAIGVGDDAAVMTVPTGKQIVVSTDSMVEGVHFFAGANPADLATKLMTVNVSDMAAMGAEPKWATIALTMTQQDDAWLASFASALNSAATQSGVELVGGDTTNGPLILSLNIIGLIDKGQAISRDSAKPGDSVYVSNTVGDAALGLGIANGDLVLAEKHHQSLLTALHRPSPQIDLGRGLVGLASACIDISDGLVGDLEHICTKSQVSMDIDVDLIPISPAYQEYVDNGGDLTLALCGGDDYQLAFCCPPDKHVTLMQLANDLNLGISNIGVVKEQQEELISLHSDGKPFSLNKDSGFQHFR